MIESIWYDEGILGGKLGYNNNFEPTCFYCGIKGHTPNAFYIRNFSVTSGHYLWVMKGNNYEGPKETWVPNKT